MTATTAPTRRATMHAAQPDPDWRALGACRLEDGDLFYPAGTSAQHQPQIARAKDVCRACPVIQQCLTWALQTAEPHGIYGGLTDDERRLLLRRQRRRAGGPYRNPERTWVQILRYRRPEFLALEAAGASVSEIAKAMGTNYQTVHNVRRGLEQDRLASAPSEGVAA